MKPASALLTVAAAAAIATVAVGQAAQCPQWQEWQAWSPCTAGNRDDILAALDVDLFAVTDRLPPMLRPQRFPHMCGNCAWRMRVRKRAMIHGCDPCMDAQVETCSEYMSVCSVEPPNSALFSTNPNIPKCAQLALGPLFMRQCAGNAAADDMVTALRNRVMDLIPVVHCDYTGGKCKCCCEPYQPAADGSECVIREPQYECSQWSEFTGWSDKCMWFNTEPTMLEGIEQHCGIDLRQFDHPIISALLKRAESAEVPERCGYCSFRVKCRTRSLFDATGTNKVCFPLDVEKRSCGNDDCEDCAEPCTLPTVRGGCNYLDVMLDLAPKGLQRVKALPLTMRNGLVKMVTNLPFGKCVEMGGLCRCCCHPYVPTDDGQSCRLADVCPSFDAAIADNAQTVLNLPHSEL